MKKICGIGEILIRYSNLIGGQFANDELIKMNFGGAEYNTICHLGNWGYHCYFLSKMNQNWLTDQALINLKKFGVHSDFIIKDQSENSRLGTYSLLDVKGSGISQVIYDRKNTSFCNLKLDEINLKKLFAEIEVIYLSGIALAANPDIKKVIYKILVLAKKAHKIIIFDFNYRAKMWTYEVAKKTYEEILPLCDIVSCGISDIEKILKISEWNSELDYEQNLLKDYQILINQYPKLKIIYSTKREILSPTEQNYQGYLLMDNQLFKSPNYNLKNYLDRIGSGDAFNAGLIHEWINKKSPSQIIDFATKAGALKHFYQGDNNNLKIEFIESFDQKIDVTR